MFDLFSKEEFLRREHDLLARVLNERALLEIEKREFRQQRDADILRLRCFDFKHLSDLEYFS